MSRRISWLLVLLGALALVGVVILIIDVSRDGTIPDRPDAISDEPNVELNAAASRSGSGERAITPRRTAESEPARTVEIEVARASGAPIADVRVVVFRDEDVLLSAKTDRTGLVRLAASTGEAHAVAAVPGYRLIESRVAMEDERTRLVLPDRLEISGVVRVDGRPPRSVVGVNLSRTDQREKWRVALPKSVRAIFDFRLPAEPGWEASTDDSGSFRFVGLPEGFSGHLHLELPYLVKTIRHGGEKVLELDAPASDVVVDAVRYAVISGRVVDSQTRAPVAGAPVSVTWKPSHRTEGTSYAAGSGTKTSAGGRFSMTVQYESVASITVEASALTGTEPARIEISDRLDEDHDLADIPVNAGRLVTIAVKDDAGEAIPNARVLPPGGTQGECSGPTSPDGRVTMRLTQEAATVLVGAIGYEVARVLVPAELTGEIDVRLAAGATLTVRIVRDGVPATGMMLKVSSKRPFLAPGVDTPTMDSPASVLLAAGMSPSRMRSYGQEEVSISFDAGSEGLAVLACVLPAVPMRIEVSDASGAVPFSSEVTLAAAERREVVAQLGKPRTFEGLVTDQDGRALEGAVVLVSQDPKHLEDQSVPNLGAHRATTDTDGRFSIPNLFAPKTHVSVSKAGYATKVERDVPVVAGAPVRIVLEHAAPVRISVVDTSGAPVDPPLDVIGIFQGVYKSRGRSEQPGVYVFDGIGKGSFEVRVARANGTWSKTLDTAVQRDVRIMIPALGVAHLTWDKELVAGSEKQLVTLTTAGVEGSRLSRFLKSGETEVRFEAVIPGVYTATIEVDPRTLKDPASRKPLAEARVEIVGGQTAEVVFKRP